MAADNSFVSRLLNVQMPQKYFENEYATLKYIAVNDGYPSSIIDTIINYKHNDTNKLNMAQSSRYFVSLEYGIFLHFILKNIFKNPQKHNINLGCRQVIS